LCAFGAGGFQEVPIGNEEQDQDCAADQDERRRSGNFVAGGWRRVRGEETWVAGTATPIATPISLFSSFP